MRVLTASIVVLFATTARATLPPTYTLERGEILADAGEERARVSVDCAKPMALAVRGSDVLVACGDEELTYTTAADVMRPALVDRRSMRCFDFDPGGRCRAPYETISLDAEREVPASTVTSYVVRRERRTTLGWLIIGASLGSAAVLEGGAWIARLSELCFSSTCGRSDAPAVLDVAAVIAAVGGTIAGVAVAATWHDVKKQTTMIVPSIDVTPGGGMIGVRATF